MTKKAKKWCMLSLLAAGGPRGDRNDNKVVHAVTMDMVIGLLPLLIGAAMATTFVQH